MAGVADVKSYQCERDLTAHESLIDDNDCVSVSIRNSNMLSGVGHNNCFLYVGS